MSSIVFIGGGNMASCLVGGTIANGFDPDDILVSEPNEASRNRLKKEFGIAVSEDNQAAVANATVVVLAVKPQIMRKVTMALAPALKDHAVVVSIAAGISVESLQGWLGSSVSIIRAMPNTPSLVLAGATALFANPLATAPQKDIVSKIFQAVGYCCWVKREDQINAVIAVSGSGPAYFFRILEIMQQVGQELGLSEEIARELASHTALGASQMAKQSASSPAELRRQVTSPGGTTERALSTFQKEGLETIFRRAMTSALERAEEMSEDFSD
ncbi:MAG: pyrroline-5-carboxylate reductase [Porticoccaceae bacterium]|tara:strand:+ start:10922 stop:11737 length:816 start_codon:yes stop_codon:yes gene_type:complete